MQPLINYIKQPDLLDADAVEQLTALVERYPYFQVARMLYVSALYQQQDDRFGTELPLAAISAPDRTSLFNLVEAPAMQPRGARRRRPATDTAAVTDGDRTQNLIDSFLAEQPDQPQQRRTRAVDASVDYMAYLMQQEENLPVHDGDDAADARDDVADNRAVFGDVRDAFDSDADDDVQAVVADAADGGHDAADGGATDAQNEDEDAFLTETLARIYIKQGKYIKANEIIRRLSLRNPKKNRYFADQIRYLEKLIANERAADNVNSNK